MQLIKIETLDGEDIVSHRTIAQGTDNDQESVARLIDTYKVQLESFGLLRFQVGADSERKLKNPDAKPTKTYYLNEHQATLLITFMRNNDIVVNFKVALVKAFYELKHKKTKHKSDPLHKRVDAAIKLYGKEKAAEIFADDFGVKTKKVQPKAPPKEVTDLFDFLNSMSRKTK